MTQQELDAALRSAENIVGECEKNWVAAIDDALKLAPECPCDECRGERAAAAFGAIRLRLLALAQVATLAMAERRIALDAGRREALDTAPESHGAPQ